MVGKRGAGKVAFRHHILERVAAETDPEGLLHAVGDPARHRDVGRTRCRVRGHQLRVPLRRTVTRFAVDVERGPTRDRPGARFQASRDLAAVARLTVGVARIRAEDPRRRPIPAVRQRHVRGDRDPAPLRPRARVAEPVAQWRRVVEGEEANRAVRGVGDESLGAAAQHVSAADDAVDMDNLFGCPGLSDFEQIPAGRVHARNHDAVGKDDRRAVERGDDGFGARLAPGPSVGGRGPGGILVDVAAATALGTRKVRPADVGERPVRGAGHGSVVGARRPVAATEQDRPGCHGNPGCPGVRTCHRRRPSRDQAGP